MDEIQKVNLLTDMKRNPCHYSRETMYEYISSGEFDYNDLVVNGLVLSDYAFSWILRYPNLCEEQKKLDVSNAEYLSSKEGNLDILLFGIPGVGRRTMLAGLVNSGIAFNLGLSLECRGACDSYLVDLCNTIKTGRLPDSTNTPYIQIIEASFSNERGQKSPFSLIEMSGEKLVEFYQKENPKGFADLGPGAEGILNNNNRKVILLFVDSKELRDTSHNEGNSMSYIHNCDVLSKLVSLFACNPSFLKKVTSIHIVLTKSDLWYDIWNASMVQDKLEEYGYSSVIETLKNLCQEYHINITTDHKVGVFPFSVGKFMPGDLYEFDETDSLKILRIIKSYVPFPVPKPKWTDKLKIWLNS